MLCLMNHVNQINYANLLLNALMMYAFVKMVSIGQAMPTDVVI